MVPSSNVEVELIATYSNGLTYFKVGTTYYIRNQDTVCKIANPTLDFLQVMAGDHKPSSFAEPGRKFTSLQEATHYVEAAQGLEALFTYITVANSDHASEEERKSAAENVKELQQILKNEYLEEVLESLSNKKAMLNLFLNQTPTQIKSSLSRKSNW